MKRDRRALVLVRIGRSHSFSALLVAPASGRNWDLAVSHYDDTELPDGACVEWRHRYAGGKWDGIWHFFSAHPDALDRYDYYWLVDDDIEAQPELVEALFDYVRTEGFELAQPALTPDSYYSHRITLACPGFRHRHTNVVEIMAPILSARILHSVLPLFRYTRSGFGLDWMWQRFVTNPRKEIAIIDAFPVRHARPLRKILRPAMEAEGMTPEEDRARLVREYGAKRLHGVAFAGVTVVGRTLRGRLRMALALAVVHWRQRHQIDKRRWGMAETSALLYRQLFSPLGFSQHERRG